MSGPAISVVFGLEDAPRVRFDACNEGEQKRLLDWIEAHEEYLAIIHAALELERERAA